MDKNLFGNIQKVTKLSNESWDIAKRYKLANTIAFYDKDMLSTLEGHKFHNMVSFSYLGLDKHPQIIHETCKTLTQFGATNIPNSRMRVKTSILNDTENLLSEYFQARAILGTSCAAITEGILPMVAAGIFTDNIRPKMIFDKFCHFSMNIVKAICADETEVITCPHNDLNFIEQACKENELVAYVADGAYSMGGKAPIKELIDLQQRYNLFLYFDDSHSLSAYGNKGYGWIRSHMDEVNNKTILVYSLAKAFGGSGGMALIGNNSTHYELIERYGGPIAWSRPISIADLGSIRGSLSIHKTPELLHRQNTLHERISYFDQRIDNSERGSPLPIRCVKIGQAETALEIAMNLFKEGFYVSPIFFPIVAKGESGLRIMLRADIPQDVLVDFCDKILHHLEAHNV